MGQLPPGGLSNSEFRYTELCGVTCEITSIYLTYLLKIHTTFRIFAFVTAALMLCAELLLFPKIMNSSLL